MTSSNSTSVSVDSNFNTIIEISIMNYLYLTNLSCILYSITKILAIHVFIVFKMMTSSNIIDLTIDSKVNTTVEISIISYPNMLNFSLILQFVTKILAILCFHYLQNDDVIKFDQFCLLIQISMQQSKS